MAYWQVKNYHKTLAKVNFKEKQTNALVSLVYSCLIRGQKSKISNNSNLPQEGLSEEHCAGGMYAS